MPLPDGRSGGEPLTEVLQFAVLGLGAGAVYALLAQGIVVIYRGSGIVNFAQGAIAMVGAFTFWDLHDERGWSPVVAFVFAVVLTSVLSVLMYRLLMRPLARSSPLVRIIATLGVLTVLTSAAVLEWGGESQIVDSLLPTSPWELGDITLSADRFWLMVIACVVAAVLTVVYRRTRFGLAVTGGAENEIGLAALGWSPDTLATVNWALGGALAGVAGILVSPLTGLQVNTLSLLVIAALAAALLGGFSSFPLTLTGGLAIGIAQSEMARYITRPGISDAVPFLAIVLVMVVRGKALPLRSHLLERLPRLGEGVLRPTLIVPSVALLAVLSLTVLSDEWNNAVTTSLTAAIILLSMVVLTGYAGQISLAQYVMAGLGAFAAARFISQHGVSFEIGLVLGVLIATVVGLVFALPALRTRGINLAVITLGLGLAVQSMILNNPDYGAGDIGTDVGSLSFFGLDIDRIAHPERYTLFALVCFAVSAVVVANLRRGRSGHRLIAVRTNERAAASLGIGIFGAKLYAFGVASAVAGLGGVVVAYANHTVLFTGFTPGASINAVVMAVLGGIGFIGGALFGSLLAVGGVSTLMGNELFGIQPEWLTLIGGVGLLVQLVVYPDGIAKGMVDGFRKWLPARRIRTALPASPEATGERRRPVTLEVRGASVQLGGIWPFRDVSLEVRGGEVVGLIGPNGAGKTTLVDAVTGFVRLSGGTVVLDGAVINGWSAPRRARAGISRTFQSLELFEDMTVGDNLHTAADHHNRLAYLADLVWPRREELPAPAVRAVQEFELESALDLEPSQLSYAQRRLVSIARALATEPSVLLLDEPAAGLNDVESAELTRMIRRLATEWGLAVLVIEHDMSVVMNACDRVVVLDVGRKIAEGSPREISTLPEVRAAYLGDGEVPHEVSDELHESELTTKT